TDGVPVIGIPDANGVTPGQQTVAESDGPMAGTFTISAQAGITSVTLGSGGSAVSVSLAELNNLGSVSKSYTTADGTLTLTGYNAGTGVVSYTFDPVVHSSNANVLANFPLTLTDANGVSSAGTLGITITDSKPVAVADVNTITEDSSPNTVSGNVLPNDAVGADTNATPVTAGTFVSAYGYGTLVLNADGSYTYTLNNANPTVNALNDNSTPLTD
ncbi:MAG: VCBS domain-containing protein, partial [Anaerolineae bacterium]|nr:VCBS domain-containing protein [Anaerolineae bacterium]